MRACICLFVSTLPRKKNNKTFVIQTMPVSAYMFALMLLSHNFSALCFLFHCSSLFCYHFFLSPVGYNFDWSEWIKNCDRIVCTSNFGRIIFFWLYFEKGIFLLSLFVEKKKQQHHHFSTPGNNVWTKFD